MFVYSVWFYKNMRTVLFCEIWIGTMRFMIEEKERGALIIIASHDKEFLYNIADKVYVLSDGYVKDNDVRGRN